MLHPVKSKTCLVPYDMGAVWIDIGDDKMVCASWDDHERKLTAVAYEVIPGPEPDDDAVVRDGDEVGYHGIVEICPREHTGVAVIDTADDFQRKLDILEGE